MPIAQVSGKVDQSASVMSDDVAEKGYALLCVARPRSDCSIKTVPEVRLRLQLHVASISACSPV